MIHEQMKKDNMEALKNKDAVRRQVLTLVLGKLNLQAKTNHIPFVDDANASQVVSKTIKEISEEMEMFKKAGRVEHANELQTQIKLIEAYLPKQLTEDEIRELISKLDDRTMPAVMKYFKQNYAGKVDMGLVNRVAKSL